MKIIITGISSMHGWPLFQLLEQSYPGQVIGIVPPKSACYFSASYVYPCSMSDPDTFCKILEDIDPTMIVHAAGMCDLDLGEKCPDRAYERNVLGTQMILDAAPSAYIFYISADLVYSGVGQPDEGYCENISPDPISVIGKTYLMAEDLVQKRPSYGIVRIGLPMGPSLQGYKGAVDLIAKRLGQNKPMTLFHDELRSGINTVCLARGLHHLLNLKVQGLYHLGGPRAVSLYEMGEKIAQHYGFDSQYLIKASRHDDPENLPRIGNVHLKSQKAYDLLDFTPLSWSEGYEN